MADKHKDTAANVKPEYACSSVIFTQLGVVSFAEVIMVFWWAIGNVTFFYKGIWPPVC